MNKIKRALAAIVAAFFALNIFLVAAFASAEGSPEGARIIEEIVISEEIIAIEDLAPSAPDEQLNPVGHPFTPAGAGTVIDHATDADGKAFYAISTPDKHVFYLVIDKQRNIENVYFLNAVTVKDLLALASDDIQTPAVEPQAPPPMVLPPVPAIELQARATPAPTPEPQPRSEANIRARVYIAAGVVVIFGGVAGWRLKASQVKRRDASISEEYEIARDYTDGDYDSEWDEDHDGDASTP